MTQTLVLYAHPFPARSVVTGAMRNALASQPGVAVRDLYQLYPDFDIDVQAEQQAVLQADLIIWLTPVYWYSVPALMKHWFEQVLAHGWAYGHDANALQGKAAWWVTSAGADLQAYTPQGVHGHRFDDYAVSIERIATYCGMHNLPHWVVHGGHSVPPEQCTAACVALREQWQQHVEAISATTAATTGSAT
jgi:glutathione-regulated potassium-efflux system ancillary protein KefF